MDSFFCRECIAAEPLIKYLFWGAVLLLATLYCLYLTFRSFKKARLIEDMPTSLVRSASQGFTELIGVAKVHKDLLVGPLTSSPCLWWKYSIEKYQRSGKSSSWVTIESGVSDKPFYIDDNSGLCLVMPEGADLTSQHKRRWRGRHRRPLSAPQDKLSGTSKTTSRNLLNILSTDMSFGGRYRYTEHLIKDSDPLYVLGHFESDASGQRTLSVEKIAGNILRSWKQDFSKLLDQYDQNGDSKLDIAEWQVVETAAKQAALKQQNTNAARAPEHEIGKPAETGLPFLIGSEEQTSLSRRYRLKAFAFGIGFLAIGSATTWYLSARGF
ncbi:MAG: E3 ubiquitin ligase family protein [Porticoccaceae bacterium]|nr:E3 ubiquitin ligase family protein [Porticoccaceae bacterium]